MTVAFEIKYPWKKKVLWKNESTDKVEYYRETFITIWHVDPEKDGTDDSCGWFMRSRHGDKKVLEEIEREFEFNWDSSFESGKNKYYTGYFREDGVLNMCLHSVVIDLFFRAAQIVYGMDWDKGMKYINRHIGEILRFAENPVDSLHTSLTRKYQNACGEEYNSEVRKGWIKETASIIYGFILRSERPWYKHPRWHIHHWKIQIHPLQKIMRYLFGRCDKCGKGFRYGESVSGSWYGDKIWHNVCCDSAKVVDSDSQ